MNEIEIEKNIPIPARYGDRKAKLRTMQVGDSFFVASELADSARGNLTSNGKSLGFKFTTRKVDGGIRIWRIE